MICQANTKEKSFIGKKLLVLGGADVHVKIVQAAKSMGVYTIVTDYHLPERSPAKQIADEYWMLSFADVDAIVKRCREEKVDGVLAYCIDSVQIPYQQVCESLGLPCFGNAPDSYSMYSHGLCPSICRVQYQFYMEEVNLAKAIGIDYPVYPYEQFSHVVVS